MAVTNGPWSKDLIDKFCSQMVLHELRLSPQIMVHGTVTKGMRFEMAWPRRRRGSLINDRVSTLGPHYHDAGGKLTQLATAVVRECVHAEFRKNDIMPWLFPAEARAALREAAKYTQPYMASCSYEVFPGVEIELDFRDTGMLTPDAKIVELDGAEPLLALVRKVKNIHNSFAVCKHVLKWMDTHCTVGAMRYYWPSITALAPNCPLLTGIEMPRRFSQPKEPIAPLLPLVRESAMTIAQGLMLAEKDKGPVAREFAIDFNSGKFTHECGLQIECDSHTYEFA